MTKIDVTALILAYLEKKSEVLRFNTVRGGVEWFDGLQWNQMDDVQLNTMVFELYEAIQPTKPSSQAMAEAINARNIKHFNPIVSYFEALPATMTEEELTRIEDYLESLPLKNKDFALASLEKWFVGTYAQATGKGQNHIVPVLVGGQGIGKTTFIRSIIPNELKDYYSEGDLTSAGKDDLIKLCENFVVNLDEIESASKHDISRVKSLITTNYITLRRPYARYSQNLYKYASLIASVNRTDFLSDVTGNRRWFPIELTGTIPPNPIEPEVYWRWAKCLFNSGFTYWVTQEEEQRASVIKDDYTVHSSERDLLLTMFEKPTATNNAKELTASEIVTMLSAKFIGNRLFSNRLGTELKALGFEQKRTHSKGRVWLVAVKTEFKMQLEADNAKPF